ncbi:hypothetical protein ACFL3I_01085 [Pseudomonadota bacterium]
MPQAGTCTSCTGTG